ncbi:integral membrane sensor signal transduction histidine kinase [Parasphaerochaeta coccoides DSM 17374]|uniref:histidine kinase n=1 Tax=Parasphaerochaeta coccoides (strain ATCC BAA-1237 / DSM 17374 / SPN1) TaxID=760011 RepID=F4GHH0_PARC1|nr:integral membrane sensor signal transduction histidine kinase [Parasphaerochaeta coccoides DSM 17374]
MEGNESIFVFTGLGVAFTLVIMLVLGLSTSLLTQENLRMQSEAEKAFNSVFIELQDNPSKARMTMVQENIIGVGVYTSQGRLALGIGRIPNILPLGEFNAQRQKTKDSHAGVVLYDNESGQIEYLRFSRLSIMLDTGSLRLTDSGLAPVPVDFPDILYIRFDGSSHRETVAGIRILSTCVFVGVSIFFLIVFNIYLSNRRYRITLEKQERLVSLGEAARTLTHEIKNPLSAITIQVALLKKMLPPENQEDISVIDHEVQRLTQLTDKVSDFLRNPVGTPQRIEMESFMNDLARLFPMTMTVVAEEDGGYFVTFDPDRARSVFENLLKNATESTAERDPEVSVSLSRDKKGHVRIRVMDRGDGIPEKVAHDVFDPFFTTKIHGSGIGLAISRQFVEAEGGSIRLYPREGGGTVAEVMLPPVGQFSPSREKTEKGNGAPDDSKENS